MFQAVVKEVYLNLIPLPSLQIIHVLVVQLQQQLGHSTLMPCLPLHLPVYQVLPYVKINLLHSQIPPTEGCP